jgi:hypothetical protein
MKLCHALRLSLGATLAAVALLAAAPARAEKPALATDLVGVPVSEAPPDHYPPPSVRWKVGGIGLLITGAAWGASFATAYNWPTVPGSAELKIPVVGPWIALGKSGCASDDPGCSGGVIGGRAALYVIDGIAQVAGLALIAEAIVMKTEATREKAVVPSFQLGSLSVTAVPVTSPTMQGVGLVGTF